MPVSNKALVLNTNIRKKLQKTETDRYNTERSHTIYALRLQQQCLINCLDLISQKLTDELFTCSPTDRQTDRQTDKGNMLRTKQKLLGQLGGRKRHTRYATLLHINVRNTHVYRHTDGVPAALNCSWYSVMVLSFVFSQRSSSSSKHESTLKA